MLARINNKPLWPVLLHKVLCTVLRAECGVEAERKTDMLYKELPPLLCPASERPGW